MSGEIIQAVKDRCPGVVRELLDRGADINEEDGHSWTPLLWAAYGDDPEMIDLLLDKGAALNKTSSEGNTALHITTIHYREKGLRMLLQRGANLDQKNNNGATPFDMAEERGFPLAKVLIEEEKQRRAKVRMENRDKALQGAVVLQHDLRRPKLKLKLPKLRGGG